MKAFIESRYKKLSTCQLNCSNRKQTASKLNENHTYQSFMRRIIKKSSANKNLGSFAVLLNCLFKNLSYSKRCSERWMWMMKPRKVKCLIRFSHLPYFFIGFNTQAYYSWNNRNRVRNQAQIKTLFVKWIFNLKWYFSPVCENISLKIKITI